MHNSHHTPNTGFNEENKTREERKKIFYDYLKKDKFLNGILELQLATKKLLTNFQELEINYDRLEEIMEIILRQRLKRSSEDR